MHPFIDEIRHAVGRRRRLADRQLHIPLPAERAVAFINAIEHALTAAEHDRAVGDAWIYDEAAERRFEFPAPLAGCCFERY
jgi:hypothetical protein